MALGRGALLDVEGITREIANWLSLTVYEYTQRIADDPASLLKLIEDKMSDERVTVRDGHLVVDVSGGPHDGSSIDFDLTLVRLAADEASLKHPLPQMGEKSRITGDFVMALCAELSKHGYPASPAIAIEVWRAMHRHFNNES